MHKMNYVLASVEEIAAHFRTISRQRIQQILQKYSQRENFEVVAKIQQAKSLLKAEKYKIKNGCTFSDRAKAEKIWQGVVRRVGKHKSYLNCTIAWESLREFRQWAVGQIGFDRPGWELDKDILVKGNRIYGPDTCVFVPPDVNLVLSGCYKAKQRGQYPIGVCFNKGSGMFVAQMSDRQNAGLDKYLGSFATVEEAFACYKATKEARIKKLALLWKDQIDPRAFEALMARQVEWDD